MLFDGTLVHVVIPSDKQVPYIREDVENAIIMCFLCATLNDFYFPVGWMGVSSKRLGVSK